MHSALWPEVPPASWDRLRSGAGADLAIGGHGVQVVAALLHVCAEVGGGGVGPLAVVGDEQAAARLEPVVEAAEERGLVGDVQQRVAAVDDIEGRLRVRLLRAVRHLEADRALAPNRALQRQRHLPRPHWPRSARAQVGPGSANIRCHKLERGQNGRAAGEQLKSEENVKAHRQCQGGAEGLR